MSGKNDKKIRRTARQAADEKKHNLLLEAVEGIKRWPFRRRFKFAWDIVFPKFKKPEPDSQIEDPTTPALNKAAQGFRRMLH